MKRIILLFVLGMSCLFANSLQDIRNRGVVKIGVYANQPPFAKFEDAEFSGFEIDLAKSVAKNLLNKDGGRIEFVPITHADKIPFLDSGKIDMVVANYTITKEREKKVDFSIPYFAINIGVLTRSSDNVQKVGDLYGKTILLKKDTTSEEFFKNLGNKIKYCDEAPSCYRMLKSGEGDAYAADNFVVMAFPVIDKSVEANIVALGNTNYVGIAVKKGSKELVNFINQELVKLSKEGFFKKSFDGFINPFYKGTADKKYFLLDDIYSIFG